MMIVFEPELWGVSPLIPDGKTPTFKHADTAGSDASAKPSGKSNGGLKLWDGGSFDFHDILDVINPLQHLPIVNAIYRSETKDEIGAVPRVLGSILYGGGPIGAVIGVASALVNIVVEHETGKDLGEHIYTAIFGEGGASRRTTEVAAAKSNAAGTTEAKAPETKPAETKPAGTKTPTVAAAANAAKTPSSSGTRAPGTKRISGKADAALQAFVAGLAKSASPAAATAASAAITKRALRVTGAGKTTRGAGAKGNVSTQFRRAEWYQRNQAILKAQAAALAKQKAAGATHASKSKPGETKSTAAILHLFTAPSSAGVKSAKTVPQKTGSSPAAAAGAPTKLAAAKPAAAGRGAAAGPWIANEIANGLSKYEALVKARNTAAAAHK
jgi:hypothetical protein